MDNSSEVFLVKVDPATNEVILNERGEPLILTQQEVPSQGHNPMMAPTMTPPRDFRKHILQTNLN